MVAMKKIAFAAIAAAASADQVAANCCPSLCGSSSKPSKVKTQPKVKTQTEDEDDHTEQTADTNEEDVETVQPKGEDETGACRNNTSALKSKVTSMKEAASAKLEFGAERLSAYYKSKKASMDGKLGEKGANGVLYGTSAICCAGVSYTLYASFGEAGMNVVKQFGSAFYKALPTRFQKEEPKQVLTNGQKFVNGVAAAAALAAKPVDGTINLASKSVAAGAAFAAKHANKLPEQTLLPASVRDAAGRAKDVVGEKLSQGRSKVQTWTPEQVSNMVGKVVSAMPAWEAAQVYVKAAVTVLTTGALGVCVKKTVPHVPAMAKQNFDAAHAKFANTCSKAHAKFGEAYAAIPSKTTVASALRGAREGIYNRLPTRETVLLTQTRGNFAAAVKSRLSKKGGAAAKDADADTKDAAAGQDGEGRDAKGGAAAAAKNGQEDGGAAAAEKENGAEPAAEDVEGEK